MQLDHFGMYPERAFMKVAGRMTLEGGGGKGSAPAAPDYTGAAQATAQGNKEAAIAAQAGNMVNQYTPYGSVEYNVRGYVDGTPQYEQRVSLSPEQQAAYNKDVAMNAALQDVGTQGLGYVQSALNKPLSFEGMQAIGTPGEIQQQAADAAYQSAMRYVEPRLQRQQASLENQLANQGITRGSEAWNAAMQDAEASRENIYGQAQSQAYLQGLTGAQQAYQQGLGARQQQIAEAQTLRSDPLNMLNAVRTGSQMQTSAMPQVGTSSPGQLATWSGPDLLGATTAQGQYNQGLYNAQQASNSAMTSGLMGLGGAGMMALAMSDRRTKENIVKIGQLDNGLNIYSFEYKPEFKNHPLAGHGKFIGVMADEVEMVKPEAVKLMDNGYKIVDYGVIYG